MEHVPEAINLMDDPHTSDIHNVTVSQSDQPKIAPHLESEDQVLALDINMQNSLTKFIDSSHLIMDLQGNTIESLLNEKRKGPTIKQYHNSIKAPIVGNIKKKKGHIPNQKNCTQEAITSIEEGRQSKL